MEATNCWNKFNLYWTKIIVIFTLCFVVFTGYSQTKQHMNLPNYDDKFLHYGFSVGSNYSIFRVEHSDVFLTQNSYNSIRSVGSYSFSLGFILNMRLAEFFDLRLLPTVSFYNRLLEYESTNPEIGTNTLSFESSFIEFPLLVKYKAQRRGNHRMYMVGGLKPGFAVGGSKDESQADVLKIPRKDLSLEMGLGLDVYYELFKFSPELRFSLGLVNIHDKIDTVESQSLSSLSTYTISLFLFFE